MTIVNLGAEGRDLRGVDLSEANLQARPIYVEGPDGTLTHFPWKANFRRANLQGADLRQADLSGAIFEEADLRGANLSEANLHRANLKVVQLDGVALSNAKYNEVTIWPEGFDPQGAGATLIAGLGPTTLPYMGSTLPASLSQKLGRS